MMEFFSYSFRLKSTCEYIQVIYLLNNRDVDKEKWNSLPSFPPASLLSSTTQIPLSFSEVLYMDIRRECFQTFFYIVTYTMYTFVWRVSYHLRNYTIHLVRQFAFSQNNMLRKSVLIRLHHMIFNHYIAFHINHSSIDRYLDYFHFFLMM